MKTVRFVLGERTIDSLPFSGSYIGLLDVILCPCTSPLTPFCRPCKFGLCVCCTYFLVGAIRYSSTLCPSTLQNLHLTNGHSSLKWPFFPHTQQVSRLPSVGLLTGENFLFLPPPTTNGTCAAIFSFLIATLDLTCCQPFSSSIYLAEWLWPHLVAASNASTSSPE